MDRSTPEVPEGERKLAHSFYRGENLNLAPFLRDHRKPDFLQQYLLKGWLPNGKIISKGTKVTAFGSCFAVNITNHLSSIGFNVSRDRDPEIHISRIGEGLVNTHALLGQLQWALEGKMPPGDLWHGFKAEDYGSSERIRLRTQRIFRETDFFVITLGLSEIWYDEITGGVFWRAVPTRSFDPSRHKFRVSSFAETKSNLEAIYDLVAKHVPDARVLFTLSPISLAASFRPTSCLTANSASKAILRAALDEMIRERADTLNSSLFYFPSYEIVQDLFYRRFEADGRHPPPYIIETIMKIFESVYCATDMNMADAEELYRQARELDIQSFESLKKVAIRSPKNPSALPKPKPRDIAAADAPPSIGQRELSAAAAAIPSDTMGAVPAKEAPVLKRLSRLVRRQ